MRDESERDFLTEAELRERINAFRAGPQTLEFAADCGLLALAVSTRFGGLYANQELRYKAYYGAYGDLSDIASDLWSHFSVCDAVTELGSPSQHDFFLPQLAAGKRIGYRDLKNSLRVKLTLSAKTCIVRGQANMWKDLPNALYLINCFIPDSGTSSTNWLMLTPSEIRNAQHTRRGDVMFAFDSDVYPVTNFLGIMSNLPSTEKWEAIRWRTDQSVF